MAFKEVFGFLKNKSKVKVYSADEVDDKLSRLITANDIFPIGSVFIDESVDEDGNSTDYSNRFGFRWERTLQGVTPIGLDTSDTDFDKVGNTGGEKEHILTVAEMPSHTHVQNAHSHDLNNYTASGSDGNYGGIGGTTSNQVANTKKGTASATAINQNTGGGKAHNNLPPYKVVAYWKRVA